MSAVQNPSFLIGNATVMVAPQSTDVFTLVPNTHSIGMTKNVSVSMDSSTIELRNGILQALVDSQKSGVSLSVSFEGYEFSAANFYRSLGIANQTVIQRRRGVLTVALAAAGTSITYNTNPIPGDSNSGITTLTQVPSGATILLQKNDALGDTVFPVRTTAATTGTGPFVSTIAPLPAGMSFAIGDTLWVVNEIDVGSLAPQDYFCMKIAGTLSNYNVPIVLVFPKVKITKGFNISFSETDYTNMPFEVQPYFLSAAEATGRLAEIGTATNGKAYVGS